MFVSRKILAVALVAILLIAGASLALASSHGGVIQACVNNDSGTIKIVSAGEECSANWSLLSWNQEGPAGADGADGVDGADGADGADGVDGVDGVDGADGVDGIDGAAGPASGAASQVVVGGANNVFSTAVCPEGTFALGGGYLNNGDLTALGSYPSLANGSVATAGEPAPAWTAFRSGAASSVAITAYAICAP